MYRIVTENLLECHGCYNVMKPKILAIIPARYESRRFPGKPLAVISGKILIEHIYSEISKSKLVYKVIVATDSDEIYTAVNEFGGIAILTSKMHKTGSDRSAEAMTKASGEIIISIQADHIGLKKDDYDRVLKAMVNDRKIKYATIIKRIESEDQLFDPNRVKTIFDNGKNALWFSRYPMPYLQGIGRDYLSHHDFFYHIGVYFFRKRALSNFHGWPQGRFEKAESLEQLRILENHQKIHLFETKSKIYSIDTPEDLAKLKI